ncbi:hypothetical protein CW731_04550 [Polaribacter sp. ALD11]|uniref:FecR family protein n=1 Tax=Polaribacter sp. ALD11 TaxID=2058137 RepID=UPI000C30B4B4|nr:FecR family protein [Polaribacter sp. ALD11]AUC84616.1 hypothetical protein CW731_04550 [Polaribacter sp. ALD11]
MTEKEFKNLLNKFLKGKATKEEKELLIAFEERAIKETKHALFFSDLEKSEIKSEIYSVIKKKTKSNYIFKLSVAASIILLIGLSSMWFLKQNNNSKILIVSNTSDQIKKVLLTDGSVVILNKKSAIKYIDNFNGTRHLDLEGEAFFNVKRNEKKPFIVKTRGINTKVLGTSFNIADNDSIISVTVATGLVKVYDANNSVLLKPNEQTRYKITSKSFRNRNIAHELTALWFKETTSLKKVSMEELAGFIKSNYNIEVKFLNNDFKRVQMSITIKRNENIESIIDQINYISELKLTLNKNNMIEVK